MKYEVVLQQTVTEHCTHIVEAESKAEAERIVGELQIHGPWIRGEICTELLATAKAINEPIEVTAARLRLEANLQLMQADALEKWDEARGKPTRNTSIRLMERSN
jgi:hypothetical protein